MVFVDSEASFSVVALSVSTSISSDGAFEKHIFLRIVLQFTDHESFHAHTTGLVVHDVLADPVIHAQRTHRFHAVHLETCVHTTLGIRVHTRRTVVRHADDRGVVLRPVDSLDVARVLVNAVVLRAVDAPYDHIRVGPAADDKLAVRTPADVVDVHGMTATHDPRLLRLPNALLPVAVLLRDIAPTRARLFAQTPNEYAPVYSMTIVQ